MNPSRWERLAPLGGVAYAVLAVVGLVLIVFEGTDSDPDAEILSYYADSGNRAGDIVGFLLVALGCLFFIVFLGALRDRLRTAETGASKPSSVVFGAGLLGSALLVGAVGAFAATAFAADFIDDFEVDPNSARLAFALGYPLLLGSLVLNAGMVLVASVMAIRTPALPAWLGWLGFVAIILAIAEAFLLPVFVLPVWTAVAGIVMAVVAPERASG